MRRKYVKLTPEEWVRQNFVQYLITKGNYPPGLMIIEAAIRLYRTKKRVDILIHDRTAKPVMMVEALRIINDKSIDLVTLDLKMPGLSGIDVLREIKNIQPDVEVIVITGYGTLNNAQEAIRFGAGDFISKPFNVADIIAIVSKSFERRNYNLKIKNLIQQIKGLRTSLNDSKESLPDWTRATDLNPGIQGG